MNFKVTAVVIALVMSGAVSAQKMRNMNLGIKAGVNGYTLDKYAADNRWKTGFHAGLLSHIHLNKQWALQPELTYSMQGTEYVSGGVKSQVKLGYINVPVLVQYMFNNGFRLEAGPQVGFLLSAKSETNDVKTDIQDNFSNIDVSIGAGLGYVHPPTGLGIDARYNFGLNNINEVGSSDVSNRGFQVGLFYLFKHK